MRAEVPANVDAIITKCLASDPAERFQSAAEIVRALDGESVAIGSTRRTPRGLLVAGYVALLAVAASGFWLARRTPVPAAGSPNPNLIPIAEGDYSIGSDSGLPSARPRHTVHVAAFRIERTEVTTGAYQRFIIATKAPVPWSSPPTDSLLPVTRVPWGDAANYCAWRYSSGGRLPTELEWEAAARGTIGRTYPYGASSNAGAANTASARRAAPVPVGGFPRGATPDGIQDMSGNVWEWTASAMEAYPGAAPLPDSLKRYRVIRGGAFDTNDSLATASLRGYAKVTATAADLLNTGFRCVTR
jgi:formylglycine-generating enzyme required for sulfatase activity